jgi:hypothetical protein
MACLLILAFGLGGCAVPVREPRPLRRATLVPPRDVVPAPGGYAIGPNRAALADPPFPADSQPRRNDAFAGTQDLPAAGSWAESIDRPVCVERAGPVYPRNYYVRGEHAPTGYIEGHYRRTDNYTRGEHTATGYVPAHYRGSGGHTRGEHTPTGYLRGHYRAEPLPFGRPAGAVAAPAYHRPPSPFAIRR